jgi:hypothetical protein
VLVCSTMVSLIAGFEVLFIFLIRGPYLDGVSWPVVTFGILATVTMLSGYVHLELWICMVVLIDGLDTSRYRLN